MFHQPFYGQLEKRTQCLDAKEVGLGEPAEETFQTLRKLSENATNALHYLRRRWVVCVQSSVKIFTA